MPKQGIQQTMLEWLMLVSEQIEVKKLPIGLFKNTYVFEVEILVTDFY